VPERDKNRGERRLVDLPKQLAFEVWKEVCKGDDAEISTCAVCSLGFD